MAGITFIGGDDMAAVAGGVTANGVPPSDIIKFDLNADQHARQQLNLGHKKSTLECAGAIWEGNPDDV